MGVDQPDSDFEMAAKSGSEYAYLLAGSEEEKKRAEALIRKVHTNISQQHCLPPHPQNLFLLSPTASTVGNGQ